MTFERIMVAHEIRKDQWPYQLAPQLTGKAQLAFAAMSSTEAKDYDAIKAAVLARYDVNEETYRRRFRSATKQRDETYRELSIRLLDLQNKWLRNCTSVKKMAELICLEQFYETLPVEIKTWVRDKKPETCQQAGELADEYVQTRQISPTPIVHSHNRSFVSQKRCFSCNQVGHFVKDCPVNKNDDNIRAEKEESSGSKSVIKIKSNNTVATGRSRGEQSNVKCYNCGQRGHISTKCPSAALFCRLEQPKQVLPANQTGFRPSSVCRNGLVEGIQVDQIVLDTGCSRTMVRQDLVPESKIIEGDAVTI